MKTILHTARWAFLVLAGALVARAQSSPYLVSKSETFVQTTASSVLPQASGPFQFSAQAPQVTSSATLTLPGATTLDLPYSVNDQQFEASQNFADQTSMDKAFPDGSYSITEQGMSAVALSLTGDLYPTVVPQITNGTWNNAGLLVINPNVDYTVDFNTFTGYDTTGAAGLIFFQVNGINNGGINVSEATFSGFGPTPSDTPITSYIIPAGTLTAGGNYQLQLEYSTVSALDPATMAVTIYEYQTNVAIFAKPPSSASPAPSIMANPTPSATTVEANATVTFNASASNFTSFLWEFNGQPIFADGNKYQENGSPNPSLTITLVTPADAGNYTLVALSPAGKAISAPAVLTVSGVGPTPTPTPQEASYTAVSKTRDFVQTTSGAPSPFPPAPFEFSASYQQSGTPGVSLGVPSVGSIALTPSDNGNNGNSLQQSFGDQGSLDAAFPDGSYSFSGSGITTVSVSLNGDQYPVDVPAVANGSWDSLGMLDVDPTQDFTLNFDTFSGYASAGSAGFEFFKIDELTQGSLKMSVGSVTAPGLTFSASPFTSYTIPAGTLNDGSLYPVSLSYSTASDLDVSLPSSAYYQNQTSFLIYSHTGNGSVLAPYINSAPVPSTATAVPGSSVTFTAVNFGTPPESGGNFAAWAFNGQPIAVDGVKYTISPSSSPNITINSLTPLDAGNYTVILSTANSAVSSPPAALTVSNSAPNPGVLVQPVSANVGVGDSVFLYVEAAGTGNLTYQWSHFGQPIAGATSASYSIGSAQLTDAGGYTVAITGPGGITSSAEADVYVNTLAGLVTTDISFSGFPVGPGALSPGFSAFNYGTALVTSGTNDPIAGVVASSVIGTGAAGYIGGAGTNSTLTPTSGDFGEEIFPGLDNGNVVYLTSSANPMVEFDIDLSIDWSGSANQQSFDFEVYDALSGTPGSGFGYHSTVYFYQGGEVYVQDNENSDYVDTGILTASNHVYHLKTTVNYQTATWSANLTDVTDSQSYTLASGRSINGSGYTLSGWTSLGDGWVDIDSYSSTASSSNQGFPDRMVFDNYEVTQLANPPEINVQPLSTNVPMGSPLFLSVSATGSGSLFYQWSLFGKPIPGATSSTLLIGSVLPTDSGPYVCTVSNSTGSVASNEADVIVGTFSGNVTTDISFGTFPTGPGALFPGFTFVENGTALVSQGTNDPISGVAQSSPINSGPAAFLGGSGTNSILTPSTGSLDFDIFPGTGSGNLVNLAGSGTPVVQFDADFTIFRNAGTNDQSFLYQVYDAGGSPLRHDF